MGTKIEWADATWNPITGCTPISEACDHCYAKRMANRLAGRYGYPADDPFQVTFHPEKLKDPTTWRKPRRIFVCSMGDLFHEDVADEWISAVMTVASICSHHTFMILTKRPARMKTWFDSHPFGYMQGEAVGEFFGYIPTVSPFGRRSRINGDGTINGNGDNDWPLPNVWLGVTVENQRHDDRILALQHIPAAVRFVSFEPLLGPFDFLPPWLRFIDWAICGGETGPGARQMELEWARSLRDQCRAAGVPFFFKKVGGGRETPDDLNIREFPNK